MIELIKSHQLVDCVLWSKLFDSFEYEPFEEIKVGDLVKVIIGDERIWVFVMGSDDKGEFVGVLDNDPFNINVVPYCEVRLRKENVLQRISYDGGDTKKLELYIELMELFQNEKYIADRLTTEECRALREKVRAIGEKLYDKFGEDALFAAHRRVASYPGAQRFVELAFHRIGGWMG